MLKSADLRGFFEKKQLFFAFLCAFFNFCGNLIKQQKRYASVTQLVEYHVANVTVDGSNPFTRSIFSFLNSFVKVRV